MRRRIWYGIGGLALLLAVLAFASGPWAQPAAGRLLVHFIDVGQADAILVTDEAKTCTILIDSGDTRYPDSAKRFKAYLQQQLSAGATLNAVIATHPHADHLGSMQWVLEQYTVKLYIDNGQPYESNLYKNVMKVVREQRRQQLEYHPYAQVPAGKEAVCGPTGPQLRVLYPKGGLDAALCEDNPNNCSVVAKVTFGKSAFLFPGDAEEEQEEVLLKDPDLKRQLDADVLKVPHHGSDTSSSPEFLDAVSPTWMVISVGEKDVGTNKGYKHPRWSTIRELLAFSGPREGARMIDAYDAERKQWRRPRIWGRLYVTARDGAVVLSSDGAVIRKE